MALMDSKATVGEYLATHDSGFWQRFDKLRTAVKGFTKFATLRDSGSPYTLKLVHDLVRKMRG